MNYGFVIDNGSCIGCHACSTACKSENQVPIGVNRTWVKYTEAGRFPDVRRSFQVTRCNHCANPPCVRICPTGAMFQRADGIVEFDGDSCIGCKGCLQACPYDAIYIDPETHTAAKCHYCAHRVDVGLEPACVVVCPEHAIIAGDLDDPASEISRVLAKHDVTVRRPEQGTAPKLFYIEGNALSLHPTAATTGDSFMWSDIRHDEHDPVERPAARPAAPATTKGGKRAPQPQGLPDSGPLNVGGNMAGHMVQVGYNAQHQVPWHWPIPLYLVTKHIAGGAMAILGLAALLPGLPFTEGAAVAIGLQAVVMTLVTLALLVYDLDRPDRFFYLLIRPQWRSWIARAAWILSGFAAVTVGWWGAETLGWLGLLDVGVVAAVRPVLAALAIPLGIGTATYTAFLFAQAEGRDLWQTGHVPVQMAAHAMALGAGPFAAFGPLLGFPPALVDLGWWLMVAGLAISLVVTLIGDLVLPHATEAARQGAREMTAGRYRRIYWLGGVGVGHVLPLLLLATATAPGSILAFHAAMIGLFLYGYAFVMAAQRIPNS